MLKNIFRPLWAEIDCANLAHNAAALRGRLNDGVEILGVVKADAYGHGAVETARVLEEQGVKRLAVASLEEAMQLREGGIGAEILTLGYTLPEWADEVVRGGFVQTVYHLNLARALSREGERQGRIARAHVKIDTGMGRIGVDSDRALPFVAEVCRLPFLKVEGTFTHMACADSDPEYTRLQFERFQTLLEKMRKAGLNPGLRHAANSATVLGYPEMQLDAVRPGILLYGLRPDSRGEGMGEGEFLPVMSLKTRIVELKTAAPGARISYGGQYRADGPRRIATAPVGYADGFNRRFSNAGSALVNGVRVPVVGAVCMDFLMLDVTAAPNVHVGDEVALVGRQLNESITVDDLAAALGTINYEVVSLVGKRVPRIHLGSTAGG